jgi:hypothetical protein
MTPQKTQPEGSNPFRLEQRTIADRDAGIAIVQVEHRCSVQRIRPCAHFI